MRRKLFINGEWVEGATAQQVSSPYELKPLAAVDQASHSQADAALAAAFESRARLAKQSTAQRRAVLTGIAAGLKSRADELASVICHEAGKPITAARAEVERAIDTFTLAAGELQSFGGRTLAVDTLAAQAGAECETRRYPAGVVVGIVPFNFPLNLGAHKVAPALAVGAPIIVKPPPQAPSAQLIVAELAKASGADPAALQVLPCDNQVAEKLATDARVRVLSFTGSARVGWQLKAKTPGKAVLELGGNAAAIVRADADLDRAAARLAVGAFTYAGQVCIKVQRIIIERRVYDPFVERLLREVSRLKVGDPSDADTVVGPVIDDRSADRIESWVDEALAGGATALVRGSRQQRLLSPTVLTGVPKNATARREEIFGPVVLVDAAQDFDDAMAQANDSAYGLQAAVFTNDLRSVRRAFHELEVGGVIVNDAPSFRNDNMPYGGAKGSGLGREGVRYAMEDFSEERVLVLR